MRFRGRALVRLRIENILGSREGRVWMEIVDDGRKSFVDV